MTKISIKNFQSIKNINFDINGFTVIIGKNNIGKSAIIRAVEAALTNQIGKEFIRKGEKKTEVSINRNDINIEWKKGATATYQVDTGSGKETFSKLNRAVPQPLIDAGFEKMEIGDQKVFPLIASQFEPLFLVDKPGSVVTEVLASLYNIDTLSKADDLCQKVLKSQKSLLKTRESDLVLLQEKLEDFKDFEDIKQTVNLLVKKEEELQNLNSEISDLISYEERVKVLVESLTLLRDIKKIEIPDKTWCEKALFEIQWLQEKEQKLDELNDIVKKLEGAPTTKIPEIGKIGSLVEEVTQLRRWDEKATRIVDEIKQQKKFLDTFDVDEITILTENTDLAMKEFDAIRILEEEFSEAVITTKTTRDELKTLSEELKQKKKKMAEIKICPLCEQPL